MGDKTELVESSLGRDESWNAISRVKRLVDRALRNRERSMMILNIILIFFQGGLGVGVDIVIVLELTDNTVSFASPTSPCRTKCTHDTTGQCRPTYCCALACDMDDRFITLLMSSGDPAAAAAAAATIYHNASRACSRAHAQ